MKMKKGTKQLTNKEKIKNLLEYLGNIIPSKTTNYSPGNVVKNHGSEKAKRKAYHSLICEPFRYAYVLSDDGEDEYGRGDYNTVGTPLVAGGGTMWNEGIEAWMLGLLTEAVANKITGQVKNEILAEAKTKIALRVAKRVAQAARGDIVTVLPLPN